MLEIRDLHASVAGEPILKGLSLTVKPGEVHAIMGPNGSGKSTLANVLAGRDNYEITGGEALFEGKSLAELEPEERAQLGLFLAFQYPVEIPGVSNMEFLKAALEATRAAQGKEEWDSVTLLRKAREACKQVDLDPQFLKRGVNEGFSGGEKKRNEIMQMLLMEPKLALLDETDSGLDIDALQTVAKGSTPARAGARHRAGDPLPAAAGLHRAGPCARALRRQDRQIRRQGTGPGAGTARLRLAHRRPGRRQR